MDKKAVIGTFSVGSACGWSGAEGTGREGKPGIARLQMGFAP